LGAREMGGGAIIDRRGGGMKRNRDQSRDPDRVYREQRRIATGIAVFLLSTMFFYVVGVATTVVLLFNFLFR
jgi:hypothetical protein